MRSLLPVLIKHGVANAEEIEIDTLAQRCRDAVINQGSVVVAPHFVSAWTQS